MHIWAAPVASLLALVGMPLNYIWSGISVSLIFKYTTAIASNVPVNTSNKVLITAHSKSVISSPNY